MFAEHYEGRRSITESGEPCASPCRGQLGIEPVCPVYDGENTMEPCMIHYCSRNNIISFTFLKCDFKLIKQPIVVDVERGRMSYISRIIRAYLNLHDAAFHFSQCTKKKPNRRDLTQSYDKSH